HADVHALEDALRAIDTLGCDEIVCAGDLVDYGLFPNETLDRLAERKIPCVRGNHDRSAVKAGGGGGLDLSRASRKFLAGTPPSWSKTIDGVRVVVHHASPRGDMDGIDPETLSSAQARALLDLAKADVLIVGHTHIGFRVEVAGRGIIINPAALLRSPADGEENPPATGTFGVLEVPSLAFGTYRASDGVAVEMLRRRLAG
ncbi:MAG TPA: metallophosphoesterase family protein, partial [Polyangiaceae bacterium]